MIGLPSISGIGVIVTAGLLIAIVSIINNFLSKRNKSIRYGKNVPGKVYYNTIFF